MHVPDCRDPGTALHRPAVQMEEMFALGETCILHAHYLEQAPGTARARARPHISAGKLAELAGVAQQLPCAWQHGCHKAAAAAQLRPADAPDRQPRHARLSEALGALCQMQEAAGSTKCSILTSSVLAPCRQGEGSPPIAGGAANAVQDSLQLWDGLQDGPGGRSRHIICLLQLQTGFPGGSQLKTRCQNLAPS